MFCLLLLGTVLSTRRLSLHAFERTPLLNNVEEEFGNRSSFESQRVRVQANMADVNFGLAQGGKERPLRELCFSQKDSKSTLPLVTNFCQNLYVTSPSLYEQCHVTSAA